MVCPACGAQGARRRALLQRVRISPACGLPGMWVAGSFARCDDSSDLKEAGALLKELVR